jgi:ATP-dependent 26S proteasome regulatory subunit
MSEAAKNKSRNYVRLLKHLYYRYEVLSSNHSALFTFFHQPERFVKLGIDPPKGVLLFGPPGTGKTLCARAVANRTDATFIRVIGSELVQKYVGEGARMVRELFEMARSKKACIIFFDEIDAIGGARFDDGAGGDNEVQRTMLELINQLDGFDPRGNIKVLMATNRSVLCQKLHHCFYSSLPFLGRIH